MRRGTLAGRAPDFEDEEAERENDATLAPVRKLAGDFFAELPIKGKMVREGAVELI